MQRDYENLRAYQGRWERETLRANLRSRPERRDKFTTISGKAVKGLYTPLDNIELDYERDLGNPGDYPFTRGIHATGYRGKPWTLRIFSGFGSAEETNARYKYLIERGNMGLSVAFDLPTLMGYDSDAPEALGEFGKCGVAVSCMRDMEILFDDIALDQISTSMTINSPAAIIWAYYIAVAQRRGIPLDQLRGTLQNDILKEYIAQKEYIFPPKPGMRLVTDTIEYASRHLPNWNSISVSGYHIREAGSTAVQEVAFTLLNGMEYVRWALERGLDVDAFAPRISFFFNAHNDFFEEIAKYRAARRIWARQMRETFGAEDRRSWLMRFHTQTAGVSLTAQQPEVNLIRVAIQALAGVLGGTQSLHTNSMDEALALPSEHAATLAMRTQQVILEESGVANTVDPLGGSYFIEALTDAIEAEVNEYFRRVDDLGGVMAALDAGFFMSEIAEASYRYAREVEAGERVIVGVNKHVDQTEDLKIPILKMDPQGYERQAARLERLRRERDNEKTARTLDALRQACRGQDNVMPHLIECAEAEATLGETVDVMREVFGVYEEPLIV
ncbi:MAG: methylmalonyl-CoA mutase family protein [Chloroflexi bacterium]|nr:methylmalonyl-CoA mutase family protein [Chloroflexota bacterium]